jgi:hypothetical protein
LEGLLALSQVRKSTLNRRDLWTYVLLFVIACVLFFLASGRVVNVYDEGILLTAAMRVMHGQMIHRDFYYNYGPIPPYLLAGVFRMLGPSVLAERLVVLVANGFLAVSLYALAQRICGRLTAAAAFIVCVLWMIGLGIGQVLQVPLFALVMLWSTWLILPIFQGELPVKRTLTAGLLVGLATLCRYDYGAGLIASHVIVMAVAIWWRRGGLRTAGAEVGTYLLGVAILVIPAAIAYVAVAPLHDLLYDIVLYTAKYYRVARELPFPTTHTEQLQEFIVYVLPPALGLNAYLAARVMVERQRTSAAGTRAAVPQWVGFVMAFTVIATMMYLKVSVRIGAAGLYLSTLLCVLLTGVLWTQRTSFPRGFRGALTAMLALLFVGAVCALSEQKIEQQHQRASTLAWILSPAKEAPQPPLTGWCNDRNPITKGFCYVLEDNHMRAVEFLEDHTRPGDTLYVGLPQHDRIFANDNTTYFATQRLPATKWSHFDPFLQNRLDIQQEMICDMERNKPPYIALDAAFTGSHEPNGSAVSTGVHLLDDYIAANYKPVAVFGVMTILRRSSSQD